MRSGSSTKSEQAKGGPGRLGGGGGRGRQDRAIDTESRALGPVPCEVTSEIFQIVRKLTGSVRRFPGAV